MSFDPTNVDDEIWRSACVVATHHWPGVQGLTTLELDGAVEPHVAGQYVQLASAGDDGVWGVRYLSLASAPGQPPEFLIAPTPDGQVPGDPATLEVGDQVFVTRAAAGKLICPEPVPSGRLWLLASGTGLAPLLSVWRTAVEFSVVLVHSVQAPTSLAYQDELTAPSAGRVYLPWVTGGERGRPRLTQALASDGLLGQLSGHSMNPQLDRVMLCGSGEFLADLRQALGGQGFDQAQIVTEW